MRARGSNFAESFRRARLFGGSVENICRTVCKIIIAVELSLTREYGLRTGGSKVSRIALADLYIYSYLPVRCSLVFLKRGSGITINEITILKEEKMEQIRGSIVALITPFNEDGSVNFGKLEELIEWHIAKKTDALLILGTTSESPTMTPREDLDIVGFTMEQVNGRVPVIASSGSNNTEYALRKSLEFEQLGVDGLLTITPYYNKANKKGMYSHFLTVADAVNIPVYIYNVPSRTGCSVPIDILRDLAQHEHIAGIKEASGDISYVTKVAQFAGDDFALYSGNDDMIVPLLSVGGHGVISVLANIMPEETHDLVMDYLNGDVKKSAEAQLKYLDLIHSLFIEVNPIPVKEAMNLMGMGVGGFRLPLAPMEDANREILRQDMIKAGLIEG